VTGDVDVADALELRVAPRVKLDLEVRPGRLETLDASPERFLRVLRVLRSAEQGQARSDGFRLPRPR
jgi:hypothetical protein